MTGGGVPWLFRFFVVQLCTFAMIFLLLISYASLSIKSASPDEMFRSFAQNYTISSDNSTTSLVKHFRTKRQFDQFQHGIGGYHSAPGPGMCPAGCFACSPLQCQSSYMHCMPQMPRVVNLMSCCCIPLVPAKPDLKTACDGEEAVAGCLNGLCGQGYECTKRRFCCRCKTGKSIGHCVNGLCPNGYTCNDNYYCCSTGGEARKVLGPCVNDLCPNGYDCESDGFCYFSGDRSREFGDEQRRRDSYIKKNGNGRNRNGSGRNGYVRRNGGKSRMGSLMKKKYNVPMESWEWDRDLE